MKEVEAFMKIQRMGIDEKIAALTPMKKAYIMGYIDRAVRESCRNKPHKQRPDKQRITARPL